MNLETKEALITIGWALGLGVFLLLLSSCATVTKSLQISSCAVADEKLSVAITAPSQAVSWLKETADQLEETAKRIADGTQPTAEDEKALRDAVEVFGRIRGCVEP